MHPFYGTGSSFWTSGDWWMGLISMVMYLVFWAVVVIIAFRLFRKYSPQITIIKKEGDSAVSILRERYARGEIDAEEFNRIKNDLES